MSRKEIYFDKSIYEHLRRNLFEIVELANTFNSKCKFYKLSLDDVKQIIKNKAKFINGKWEIFYSDVCNIFGIDKDDIERNEELSKLADVRYKPLQEVVKRISFKSAGYWNEYVNYIDIDKDNQFIVLEHRLKEDNTTFAETEKEIRILEAVIKIKSLLNEIGANRNDIKDMFSSDMEIYPHIIKRLAK